MIYSYQKHIDILRTVEIKLPEGDNHQRIGTELATVNGTTYVFLPAGVTLPAQPAEITVLTVTLTPELTEEIKAASPHVQLINTRIKEKIRDKYDAEDEMYFARISIGQMMGVYLFQTGEDAAILAYGAYVESIRQWGRDQRAALGLQ